MNLTDRINNDIKEAMKSGDKERLMALRDIKSKLLLEMTKGGSDGQVEDAAGMAILNKLYKQRQESIEIFTSQGRQDLVDEEKKQAAVIASYLPAQLSEEELESELKKIIENLGASAPSDLGKVMGVASKTLAGRADGKAISSTVKRLLS
jgi:uncharacterized protein YqeY